MGAYKRGRPKWPWILGGVVLSCVALSLMVGFVTGIGPYDLPAKSRALDGIVAESERLGLPMTADELTGPAPDPETNAAPEVVRVMSIMGKPSSEVAGATRWSDLTLQAAQERWTRERKQHLDEIVTLLIDRPDWYFERDWDMGPFLLFPEYADLKAVSKLLAARGARYADAKDTDAAIRDFIASRRLSQKLATEPTLIAMLVSIAVDSICLRSLEGYVESWRGDAARLRRLEQAVASTKHAIDPRIQLRCEFYADLNICRNFDRFGGNQMLEVMSSGFSPGLSEPLPSEVQRTGTPQGMFERASFATIAEAMNEVFKSFEKNGVRGTHWGTMLDERARAMKERTRASEVLAMILFPVFKQAEDAMLNDDANQDLALAFVRAFRFRAERGRWPSSLKEIDAEFPDPFNPGGTIQARFSDTSVRVWSVGRDRKDDGGKIKGEAEGAEDTVFLFPPSVRETLKN